MDDQLSMLKSVKREKGESASEIERNAAPTFRLKIEASSDDFWGKRLTIKTEPREDDYEEERPPNSKLLVPVDAAKIAKPKSRRSTNGDVSAKVRTPRERPLSLPAKRPRRKYKFRNVAGGYAYQEQLHPIALPEIPEGVLLGSHPARMRVLIGIIDKTERVTSEQETQIYGGGLPVRKLVLEQLSVGEWMQLARTRCETDGIVSLADPRTHELGNEALRTYVVHFLKGNMDPDPERDDCKGSPKLTPDQCQQLFAATMWSRAFGNPALVQAAETVVAYYYWSGWKVRVGSVQVRAFEDHEKPPMYRNVVPAPPPDEDAERGDDGSTQSFLSE